MPTGYEDFTGKIGGTVIIDHGVISVEGGTVDASGSTIIIQKGSVVNRPDAPAGYVQFRYLAGKATDYILAPSAFRQIETYQQATTGSTEAWYDTFDVKFSLGFHASAVIKGRFVACLRYGAWASGSTYNHATYVTVKVLKYSGGTETELASQNTSTVYINGTSEVIVEAAVDIDLPATDFADGDELRVEFIGRGYTVDAETLTMRLYYDSRNEDTYVLIPYDQTSVM